MPKFQRINANDRGYTYQWQQARQAWLDEHPLCVICKGFGRTTVATVVDHIQPHRGDAALFWDRDNWQSLCKAHHDSTKRRIESGKQAVVGWTTDGRPVSVGG